jgi:dUTP pyrophosphatase
MKIKVKKLHPEAKLPEYAHPGDAGMDIFSLEDYELNPGERHMFKTGISIAIPRGYVALIWDKSGLASRYGISTLGGVIDADYRGEYKIVLLNTSDKSYNIKKGDKIAQVIIQPVVEAETEEVEDLDQTDRGSGSFGSTGK